MARSTVYSTVTVNFAAFWRKAVKSKTAVERCNHHGCLAKCKSAQNCENTRFWILSPLCLPFHHAGDASL